MMTVTDVRYEKPTFKDGKVCLVRKGHQTPIYVEAVKYVITSNDMVFFYNGANSTIDPSYGSIRRKGKDATNQVKMELVTRTDLL